MVDLIIKNQYNYRYDGLKMQIVKPINFSKYLGQCIKYHRKQANLSQLDLANLADIGKTVVFDIEHGKTSVQFNSLLSVLYALNINLTVDSPLINEFKEQYEKS